MALNSIGVPIGLSTEILRSLPESSGSIIEGPDLTARTSILTKAVQQGKIRDKQTALQGWNYVRSAGVTQAMARDWVEQHGMLTFQQQKDYTQAVNAGLKVTPETFGIKTHQQRTNMPNKAALGVGSVGIVALLALLALNKK